MDFVFVLAQNAPAGTPVSISDKLFANYPPIVAVPAFVVGLVLVALLFERVVLALARKLTARTVSKVDDALVDGLPSVVRPVFVLIGLHTVVNVMMRVEDAKEGSSLTQTGRWVNTALVVVTTLVVSYCLVRLALRIVDAWVAADPVRVPVGPPVKFGIKVVMAPLAIITAAELGGAQLTSVVTAVGVGGLAVGLALQDTLKNVIAGIQIVLDRPIRTGDYVEVDRSVRGTVLEIGLRSTKLRSPDSNTIIIPNGTIANAIVTNFDYADRSYIQTFQISVAYGSDTRRVQKLLDEVAAGAAKDLDGVVADLPCAALTALAESGIDFTVSVKLRQWAGRQPIVTELHHRFYDRLRAEGIEIPFPTRTLFIRNETATSAAPSTPLSH